LLAGYLLTPNIWPEVSFAALDAVTRCIEVECCHGQCLDDSGGAEFEIVVGDTVRRILVDAYDSPTSATTTTTFKVDR
jgi:hypothetical protein